MCFDHAWSLLEWCSLEHASGDGTGHIGVVSDHQNISSFACSLHRVHGRMLCFEIGPPAGVFQWQIRWCATCEWRETSPMSFLTEECVFLNVHPGHESPETDVWEMFVHFSWRRLSWKGLVQQSLQSDWGLGPCLALKQYVIQQAGAVRHGGRDGKTFSGVVLWIMMRVLSSHVLEGKNCRQLAALSCAVTVSWWRGVQYKGV